MTHDVVLPGLPVELTECPLCGRRPVPVDVYPYGAPRRWNRLIETGDINAINEYLVRDRALFRHGLVDGGRCPAEILPGPALNGLTPAQARNKASDLMKLLGLL